MGRFCYQSSIGHQLAWLENAIKVPGRARERKDVDLNAINIALQVPIRTRGGQQSWTGRPLGLDESLAGSLLRFSQ